MIGFLKGILLAVDAETVLIDTGGVGYELNCPNGTLADLSAAIGQTVGLWVYTHVREDALILFGFPSRAEKELFLSLLKVNGVGPRLALNILSGGTLSHIIEMIESGNAKGLTALPKVGKKTAEQIILSLQGKLVRVDAGANLRGASQKQIHTALISLGFKAGRVEEFVVGLPLDIEVEEGVRRGLSALSNAL